MPTKIVINGFGRIGRQTFQVAFERPELEIVAINDLTDNETLAHLLKYDSVYGHYEKPVKATEKSLIIDGKEIKASAEPDPEELPWKDLGIDIVLECTGFFTEKEKAEKHLKAGAKKVIISAPSKSEDVPTFVLGVNEKKYNSEKDHIISNTSCTTNAFAPVVKVLNDEFGIVKGLMTTIHSYTSTQNLVDGPPRGKPDLRRARAAAVNFLPTTTGSAKDTVKVIPELEGRLDAIAVRVPTPCVSLVDFTAHLTKPTTVGEVAEVFKKAAQGDLKGILAVTEEPLVSIDFRKNTHSAIVDLPSLRVIGDNLVKVLAWYDNEWGYAERLVDMAEYVAKKL